MFGLMCYFLTFPLESLDWALSSFALTVERQDQSHIWCLPFLLQITSHMDSTWSRCSRSTMMVICKPLDFFFFYKKLIKKIPVLCKIKTFQKVNEKAKNLKRTTEYFSWSCYLFCYFEKKKFIPPFLILIHYYFVCMWISACIWWLIDFF